MIWIWKLVLTNITTTVTGEINITQVQKIIAFHYKEILTL